MRVICLQDEAYYALVEELYARLKKDHKQPDDKWVSGEEAMRLLNITSKTTLQKLRDEGSIRYSQPQKKVISYDRSSINDYLEKHARNTF